MLLQALAVLLTGQTVAPASPLERHLEFQLVPVTAQVNGVAVEHVGTLGRVAWRFSPYLGLYVGGGGNWLNQPSPAMDGLHDLQRIDALRLRGDDRQAPVQSTWQAFVGAESVPLRGPFMLGGVHHGEFGLAVFAGLGPGGSRARLVPQQTQPGGVEVPALFGDTGVRLVGHGGLALRFGFGAFALHLGARVSLWSERVERVNGCTATDLLAMDTQLRSGSTTSPPVSASCASVEPTAVATALALTRLSSDAVSFNVAGEFGVSWSAF